MSLFVWIVLCLLGASVQNVWDPLGWRRANMNGQAAALWA